jgi:hypothetical protein
LHTQRLLQLLVTFEKHWTKSDKERAYAVAAFVSQLLNSVLVLLLVNAKVRMLDYASIMLPCRGPAHRRASPGSFHSSH